MSEQKGPAHRSPMQSWRSALASSACQTMVLHINRLCINSTPAAGRQSEQSPGRRRPPQSRRAEPQMPHSWRPGTAAAHLALPSGTAAAAMARAAPSAAAGSNIAFQTEPRNPQIRHDQRLPCTTPEKLQLWCPLYSCIRPHSYVLRKHVQPVLSSMCSTPLTDIQELLCTAF